MVTRQTDSNGEATFTLDPGDYETTVSLSGYHDSTLPFTVEGGEERDISITLSADEPSYVVDHFGRSSISPWYTRDGYEPIATSSQAGLVSDTGLYMQPGASGMVTEGLENFPTAGGGPNNDGAFQFWYRMEESGGTANITRVDFAMDGNDHYRLQIEDDYVGFRVGGSDAMSLYPSLGVGDIRCMRINQWTTGGDLDFGIYDTNGNELARDSFTDSRSARPQGGGLRTWTNGSTAFSIDEWELIA